MFPTPGFAEARLRLDDPHWSSQPASQPSGCALKRAFNPPASEKIKETFLSQLCFTDIMWQFGTKTILQHEGPRTFHTKITIWTWTIWQQPCEEKQFGNKYKINQIIV